MAAHSAGGRERALRPPRREARGVVNGVADNEGGGPAHGENDRGARKHILSINLRGRAVSLGVSAQKLRHKKAVEEEHKESTAEAGEGAGEHDDVSAVEGEDKQGRHHAADIEIGGAVEEENIAGEDEGNGAHRLGLSPRRGVGGRLRGGGGRNVAVVLVGDGSGGGDGCVIVVTKAKRAAATDEASLNERRRRSERGDGLVATERVGRVERNGQHQRAEAGDGAANQQRAGRPKEVEDEAGGEAKHAKRAAARCDPCHRRL